MDLYDERKGEVLLEEKMGRRERKKLQSRKTILEAAISEFSKKGYKETSVADIMSTADLGIGTFYNYFNSKEDLLFSLLGRLSETIRMALAEARAAERTSLELLELGAHVTAKFLDENRFVMPLFLSASHHGAHGMSGEMPPHASKPSSSRMTPQIKQVFTEIIREGQAAGEIRSDVPVDLIAEMFHSLYQAAAFSYLDLSYQENIALKTRLLLDGIRKRNEEHVPS
jgi:transcriptional regulator, TetR family